MVVVTNREGLSPEQHAAVAAFGSGGETCPHFLAASLRIILREIKKHTPVTQAKLYKLIADSQHQQLPPQDRPMYGPK